jgi:hypothetical protein
MKDMDLVGIEDSTIIYITQMHRPVGAEYLPDAAAKIATRYSFAKLPSLDDLFKDIHAFRMGKFQDVQINDFSIYRDGLIASGRCDSDLLDAFIADLLSWAEKELGLIPTITAKPETHYESSVVVKANCDLIQALRPQGDVAALMNRFANKPGYIPGQFQLSALLLECDFQEFMGRRRPARFVVERRIGVPFDENVFFSRAPLRTADHLACLDALEKMATHGAASRARVEA